MAGAPRLRREPTDEIAYVLNFERSHELVETLGFTAAADVENRMHVAAASKKRRVTALHITAHGRETHWAQRGRLEVFVISMGAENDRKSLGRGGAKDIAIEQRAVRHANFY